MNDVNQTLVECEQVTKVYADSDVPVQALKGVSLQIKKGEFVSLCGPSGSGKTTLLNLIGGLDTPSSGQVKVEGVTISALGSSDRAHFRLTRLGFIFQAYNLVPVLSAQENVEFVMQLQGVAAKERASRSRALLAEVGLEGLEKRRPSQLSGGQQQRVAVARAIVSNPCLVLADEPTANLDSKTAERLLELMIDMNKNKGVTFLFSTHDSLVMEYARRIVSLKDGSIVDDETK